MRTTININKDLKIKLETTSNKLHVSTNDLIALLLNTVADKNIFNVNSFNGIKYQDPDPEKNWQKLHVTFKPPSYDKGLDFRRFFKYSVSFVISFAIFHFLDKLAEQIIQSQNEKFKVDNYPTNYIFIANTFNCIQGFIVLWGIPEEKHLRNFIP